MPSNVQQNGLWCFVLKSASIIYIGISMYIWYWEFEMYINVYLMYSMFHILIFHVANFFVGPKDHRKSTACVPGKLYRSVCGCRCCRPRITAPIRMTQSQRQGMTVPRESPLVTSPIFACPSGQPMVLEYAHQHLPKRPKSPSFVNLPAPWFAYGLVKVGDLSPNWSNNNLGTQESDEIWRKRVTEIIPWPERRTPRIQQTALLSPGKAEHVRPMGRWWEGCQKGWNQQDS